eukprot:CAMPEP_0182427420 /NCGR_PEP_ID=MMETSP1167-20130531/17160_1 /TAXON_ID=2988 /ORGANISM="Mallomonas Sp, Strain CCMP3275" /LENGTH=258 /DNA_ID=CAMNT_0024609639 /DNA_START=73 /DNA_END=849 /DNA_ORIENTATION=-
MSEVEQFCTLISNQKGSRACSSLVNQILQHRKIYVFGEFLALPSVQSLRDTEFSKSVSTLELFAYGSYSEYREHPEQYTELSDLQQMKLRQLSIIKLGNEEKIIPYSTLQKELYIDNIRSLEDLVIETIYSDLLKAKLDQRAGLLRVRGTIGRDVRPSELYQMRQKLELWREKCGSVIQALEESSIRARTLRATEKTEQAVVQKEVNSVKGSIRESIAFGDMDRSIDDSETDRQRTQGGRSKRNRATYFGGAERSRMG